MPSHSLQFLPRDLRKALKPFQKEGIRYGIEKNGRCLIGDEMGLGKTLQALSIAYYFKSEWPLIIIVPSSLKYTWVDEIEKWLPEIPPEDINLIKSSSDFGALKQAKINIISYGLISLRKNLNEALLKGISDAKFGVGIVDESHFIKCRKTTRTQKITELLRQVKRVILLTGTPSLARPEELFSQINIISPHLVGNWQFFGERYCDGHFILQPAKGGKVIRKFDTRGASNLKELHGILKRNMMIRRLKKDVLTELPAKRRQRIRFEIAQDSERRKALEKSLKSFKTIVTNFKKQLSEDTNGKLLTMNNVYSSMIVLFKHTGLAKAGAIQEYISDLLDGMPNKFIVFCYHLDVISAVTEILAKRNIRYVRIAGDVPPEVRANYVKEFQNNAVCRVAVLSILASSMGITLTAADHVVFAELHWTPGVIKQAEDRCHRIGQKNSVQVHFLTARGTIDDLLWSMLSRKLTVTSETLDGETQLLTADDGDKGMGELLSLCDAWIPDDNDDEIALFTPKPRKGEKENQRDIRACFLQGVQAKQKGTKRKTRAYYRQGFSTISDSSDAEFKPQHKRSKKGKSEGVSTSNDLVIIDSDDDSNFESVKKQSLTDSCLPENNIKHETETNSSEDVDHSGPMKYICPQKLIKSRDDTATEIVDGNMKEREDTVDEAVDDTQFSNEQSSPDCITEHRNLTCCISDSNSATETVPCSSITTKNRELGISSQLSTEHNAHRSNQTEHCNAVPMCIVNVEEETEDDLVHGTDTADSVVYNARSEITSAFVPLSASKTSSLTSAAETLSKSNIPCSLQSVSRAAITTSDDSHEECFSRSLSTAHALQKDIIVDDSMEDSSGSEQSLLRIVCTNVENSEFDREEMVMDNHESSMDLSFDSLKDTEIAMSSWSCSACTFYNHEDIHYCEMCNTARRVTRMRKKVYVGSAKDSGTAITTEECKTGFSNSMVLKESKHRSNAPTELELPQSLPTSSSAARVESELSSISNSSIVSQDADAIIQDDTVEISQQDTAGGQDSISETVSVRSDSSSDVEEDWSDRKMCFKSKVSHDSGNNQNMEDSSVYVGENSRSNALSSGFCVADAFCKGNFQADRSSFTSEYKDLGKMSPLKMEHNRFFNNSPLLFSSSDNEEIGSLQSGCESECDRELDCTNNDALNRDSLISKLPRDCHDGISEDGSHSMVSAVHTQPVFQARSGDRKGKTTPEYNEYDALLDDDIDLSDIPDDEISIESLEKRKSESDIEEAEKEPMPVELKFKMSFESDRVYLYNQADEPLGINFRAPDVGIIIADDMPKIFSHPHNLQQLKRFTREWNLLTTTMQRQVRKAGYVFNSPLQIYNELKEARYGGPSKDRFTSKEKLNMKVRTIADMIGGTVTEVTRTENQQYGKKNKTATGCSGTAEDEKSEQADSGKILQAVDTDGYPICLFCNKRVQNGFKAGLSEARFCSYNCKEEYMVRTSKSGIVRERLFATENGVCQMCQFDSHGLFAKIIALRKKDRRNALEMTHFKDLPAAFLNKIIMDPKEGQFWEADHLIAVSEGGGECGLDNYRTLCVPCHREVTKDLNKRLQKIRKLEKAKAAGNGNIEVFFKHSSPVLAKGADQHNKESTN